MRNTIIASFVFFLFAGCVCMGSDNNQIYKATASFSFKLNDDWKIKVGQELVNVDGENSVYMGSVSFSYAGFAEWLVLGAGYKQYHADLNNDWIRENRPFGEATFKKTMFGVKWSDRNRLEYRDVEGKEDQLRYRNKLKAHIPHDLFGLPVQPYTAYELFVQEERGDYQNRIYGGLVWDVCEKLDLDLFVYRVQVDTSSGYESRYVIGFETKFSF